MILKITSSICATAIFFWILPLGIFIKPSQEKSVCDGQRAFHMCSSTSQVNPNPSSVVSFDSDPGPHKEKTSSAAGGPDVQLAVIKKIAGETSSHFYTDQKILSTPSVYFSIDHPPQNLASL